MSAEWSVYVDESGNDGMDLGQEGVSDYYILAAVAVRSSDLPRTEQSFGRTKESYFQQAPEMKSQYVGNDGRRLEITASLAQASFELHAYAIDKRRLRGNGLAYPKSFAKYFLQDLISELLRRYESPVVRCDRMKGPEFEEEMTRFIYRRHPRYLLRQWTFDFVDSRASVCIQAADLIAGTVHRCCQRFPAAPEQDQLLQLLGKHLARGAYRSFPGSTRDPPGGVLDDRMQRHDPQLEMKALSDAEAYVQRTRTTEPAEAVLAECVAELLKHNALHTSGSWVPTRHLAALCEEVLEEEVSPRKVRSFIGRLRDEGLLIASRRNPGGYKFPNRMADVVEYLNTQNEKIRPMMRRIQKARNTIYGLSGSDILADAGFQNLLRLLPGVGTPADNI